MARWKNINGVLQKIAGSVRIDQVLNKLSRNAISNKAVSEKFETVDTTLDSHQDAIDGINTQLNGCVRFPNYSQQETVTSGWVATYDCLLTYSIIGIANQVDTAVAINGKGVARAATNTGSITVQNSICVKKGQTIELSGYSPSGTLIVYPLE
jgi:hypothetical protein